MNVGEVAALAGVTVRTLHHYDRIGLLSPSGRTAAGYRQYAPADLDRLHQVLLYRELGFPLEEVATLLDDPSADPEAHLRRQHRLLRDRLERTSGMVAAVEKEMEARAMGISLTPEERFEVFGENDPAQYDAEVRGALGRDRRVRSSPSGRRRRTPRTTGCGSRRRAPTSSGASPPRCGPACPRTPTEAMDLAEEHRQQITRNFYDCPPEMHAGLGRMYVEDERFTAHYEEIAPGLAQYVSTAVQANAARQG